ncbi:MAG: hypothetical protein HW421_3684 [Ignavibacteria bacterium]|nr:hypothetical protein [Ignavibacteria bacterium]
MEINTGEMSNELYIQAVKTIKSAILQSRYAAALLANKELLQLYFYIGKYVSYHTRLKSWGSGAIETISAQLQQELPGLRGFSATNIKNMRIFYEEWHTLEQIPNFFRIELKTLFVEDFENRQLLTAESLEENSIRQLPTAEIETIFLDAFFKLGFTLHREIIRSCQTFEERKYYINTATQQYWNVDTLKYHLRGKTFQRQGKLTHNFTQTIVEENFRNKALQSFKDELLLDFINIEDADDEPNERILENAIIQNIKKFIMALGTDFSFVGNQYRIIIEEEEFFIDLLFFNRKIQSLVAVELKRGKFKAEYVGKMNLYLSALDEFEKQPHENPSIGIILCKEKNNTIVEFAFRDTTKPMGVVTYKTAHELPEMYKNILPGADKLKQLLLEKKL